MLFTMNKHLMLAVCFFILLTESQADPEVTISDGHLKGKTLETRKGKEFSAFIAIPYAQPPIGDLRFRSPVAPKKWEGTYFADKDANMCAQPFEGKVFGNEDCLYLNVFSPKMDFSNVEKEPLLPVLVWIHGGGFHQGSNRLLEYGPNYLLDKDIILVTINYRLGILGFLTTGDSVAPGNFGMKDQNFALIWVQKNIHAFGGDANRVTIFGESAGGTSVNMHALSEKSEGLFHQYIAHSGNALVPWGFRERNDFKNDVHKVAKKLECPVSDSQGLVDCLREKDFFSLVNLTTYEILEFPEISWLPTNEVENDDAFLTDIPANLINDNKLRDYPVMTGSVADEGLYITIPFYANTTSKSTEDVLKKGINGTFNRFLSIKDQKKFEEAIINYYFNGSISSSQKKILKNFTEFSGDSEFVYPVTILAEKMAKVSKNPVYLYMFGYRGGYSYLNLEYNYTENIGVNHADDLLYLLSGEEVRIVSKTDEYVIDLMVDLWTSFVTNGKPTSSQLAVPDLWEPYTTSKSFLQIGNVSNNTEPCITLQQNYLADRMNFWKENFPLIKI